MKAVYIIVPILAVIVILLLVFKDKLPFVSKIVDKKIPTTFVREDEFGKVTWSYDDGLYTYVLDYGIVGGIVQESTKESFMEAYKS